MGLPVKGSSAQGKERHVEEVEERDLGEAEVRELGEDLIERNWPKACGDSWVVLRGAP